MRRHRESLRGLRPRIVPGGNKQRIGMAAVKALERGNDEILSLAVLELSAREHREPSGETSGARARRKQLEIDALGTVAHRKPMARENVRIPRRSGDDGGEFARGLEI